ncbi:hypothetical protein [Thiolapillus sp.]|uniref:hypothetical protein n=1 Tax=Thiolapillus sp. TaxID=2017437 RepID=UPI003AF782F1
MITRQMTLEYGLAHYIAKCGFGENIIVGMTTRMSCTPSVRSLYIRVDFSCLTALEITKNSDWSFMTLRLRGRYHSVTRDLYYLSDENCKGSPELATKPEECHQRLNRLVMSMFAEIEGDLKCLRRK